MPHYRITIKLENKNVQEFIIEDSRTQIDFVYLDYRKRVYQKNGAGRVTYFDLVMLADESVKHQEDREEVYNQKNNYGIDKTVYPKPKSRAEMFDYPKLTLGEKAKLNRENG